MISYHAGYDKSFHFPDFQFRLLAEHSKDVRPLILSPHLFRDGDLRETFWLVEANFRSSAINQKQCPDLGSDASSVWNFCARFSDVILQGNRWWRRKRSSAFSGYMAREWYKNRKSLYTIFTAINFHSHWNMVMPSLRVETNNSSKDSCARMKEMFDHCSSITVAKEHLQKNQFSSNEWTNVTFSHYINIIFLKLAC